MKKIFSKINFFKNRKIWTAIFALVFLGVFVCVNPAFAGIGIEDVLSPITILLHALISGLGFIVTALIWVLIMVAKVNNFINVPPVQQGWVIVRDLCNMFFILVLLIIAFATILRVESYNAKKLLPKLVIMAILINFSKTICGLIIDFSQVIMLAFVYSFEDISGTGFANMMGLPWVLEFQGNSSFSGVVADTFSIVSAYILGVVYVVIAIIVIGAVLGVLIVRVVMIWIYVVLSPLAYLASTFPQGQGFANKWWSEFLKYVTTGPVLAFFIWLAFTSMQGVAQGDDVATWLEIRDKGGNLVDTSGSAPTSLTEAGKPDHLIQFAISIGMLLGGMMVAQSAGGAMGKAANIGAKLAKGGLSSGADAVNRFQSRHGIPIPFTNKRVRGLDFNLKRVGGRIMEGRKEAIGQELKEMGRLTDSNLDKGGLLGLATGAGSAGFYGRYMNMRGMGRLAKSTVSGAGIHITEEGRIKSIQKKRNKLETQKNTVYSQEEYTEEKKERLTAVDDEVRDSLKSAKKERADLQKEKAMARLDLMSTTSTDEERKAAGEKIKKLDVQIDLRTNTINNAVSDGETRKKKISDEFDGRVSAAKGAKTFFTTKAEADKERKSIDMDIADQTKKIAKSAYFDYRSQKSHESAVREEEKNIMADDEDQLVVHFDNAVAEKNAIRAEAILRKLASIRGTNTLMLEHGREKVNADTFSDFIKEQFQDKLGMSEQQTLAMQSNLDGIGQSTGVDHVCKTVKIDESGKYRRIAGTGKDISDSDRQRSEDVFISEMQKQDSEKLARQGNRLLYGAEGQDGEFEWTPRGLNLFLNNLQGISKEMKTRFNKNAATQISKSEKSMDTLKKILENNDDLMELVKAGGNYNTADEFMDAIKLRGTQSAKFETILDSTGKVVEVRKKSA